MSSLSSSVVGFATVLIVALGGIAAVGFAADIEGSPEGIEMANALSDPIVVAASLLVVAVGGLAVIGLVVTAVKPLTGSTRGRY